MATSHANGGPRRSMRMPQLALLLVLLVASGELAQVVTAGR